jgi:hypothetical protein
LSRNDLAAFISKLINYKCLENDSRVAETFTDYDHDEDGFLTLPDFIAFYTRACKERPEVVWKNLYSFDYRNDLNKIECEEEDLNEALLPRNILSTHEQFYSLLFQLLDEEKEIASEVWKMLNRLPVSQFLLDKLLSLKGITE